MIVAWVATLWHGFCVAGAAGELLAICADPATYSPLWRNAQPVFATALAALSDARSAPVGLTTEVNPAGSPADQLDDGDAERIRVQILLLAAALNAAAARAGCRNADPADTDACRVDAMMAGELHDCYSGRLRSFLNPSRTSLGPGSFVVPGKGHRKRRRRRR